MKRAFVGLLLLTLVSVPALAAQRIQFDPGGAIFQFIEKYIQWQNDGERVIIDGMCISACTLILAIMDDDRVCVTPRARLVFHSASAGGAYHREATRIVWHMYPRYIREMLKRKGWDGDGPRPEHPELIYVEGDELLTIYRACTPADYAAPTS